MSKKILVIHGPNLNLLGRREPEVYGTMSLDTLNLDLLREAGEYGVEVEIFQSNHEGAIVDCIQQALGEADFIIINPAAFTHYSLAIRDALQAVKIPVIEVHLSNIYRREQFRRESLVAPVAVGQITGLGPLGYRLALKAALEYLEGDKEEEGSS